MSDDSKSKKQPTGDYGVGYARPPKSGQWLKGQSGNPKGRPKHKLTSDWVEALHEAGQEIVDGTIRGKRRRMTLVQAAAFRTLMDAGANPRARRDAMEADEIYARRNRTEEKTECTFTLVFDEEDNRMVELAKQVQALQEELLNRRNSEPH